MAVQMNYIAPKGWRPPNPDEDYLITLIKMELSEGVPAEKFAEAAASIAAESSTGTWTKVDEGSDSGMGKAEEYKALVFDLEEKRQMFKVAYKADLFEHDNMSGLLAGPEGNIGGMKMIKGLRIFDMRFPQKIVKSFPGPRFGIEGVRDLLNQNEKQRSLPIMGTVPKPKVGRSAPEQALLARRLWTAGDGSFDFIKDDENLTNLPFNKFDDRCKLVHEVQRELESKGGLKKLYLCNLTHSNIDEMLRRAGLIAQSGGRCLMIDVVTTGPAAVHTIRLKNPGLIIHGHRAMHAFITRESGRGISGEGELRGFSISMLVLAKIYRLLGVDSLHVGSPKSKMQDYGEAEMIAHAISADCIEADHCFPSLGQNWFGMKKVWPTASGGLHPGVLDTVVNKLGHDIYIQMGGGVLGHPDGIEAGVIAALEARNAIAEGLTIKEFTQKNSASALGKAVELWGSEPRIVY